MFLRASTLAFSTAFWLRLAAAACAVLDPPTDPIPSQWVNVLPMAWDNTEAFWRALAPDVGFTEYHNWALDQIVDGNGTVNVCMRWNSNATLDEHTRSLILAQHVQQYQQWLQWLTGWDNFPFKKVNFKAVAWAVANDSQLVGPRDDFHVYTEFKDDDGLPTCDPGCSRNLHPDGNYSSCALGPDHRFHHYFLISDQWGDADMGYASGEGINMNYRYFWQE